jgi:hypothetical protein
VKKSSLAVCSSSSNQSFLRNLTGVEPRRRTFFQGFFFFQSQNLSANEEGYVQTNQKEFGDRASVCKKLKRAEP